MRNARRRRRRKNREATIRQITASAATTPPAIAPAWLLPLAVVLVLLTEVPLEAVLAVLALLEVEVCAGSSPYDTVIP